MSGIDRVKTVGVVGTVRSGSTLLTLMLGRASGVFAAGETNRIWRHRPAEVQQACWCGGFRCPFWTEEFLAECKVHTYRVIAERAMAMFGLPMSVFSDKRPSFYAKQLKRGDQLDWLIVVFKTPAEFMYSMYKRGVDFDDAAWSYAATHDGALKLAERRVVPTIFIEYHKLVSDTAAVLKAVCESTAIEYSPEMCAITNKCAIHMLGGSEGLRSQIISGVSPSVTPDESWRENLPALLRERTSASTRLKRVYERLCLQANGY